MFGYTIRRIISSLPTLAIIVTLSFFMMRLTPGGPFDSERPVPPEIERNLAKAYHLDEPLYQQFGRYVYNLLQGDFGPSFKYKDITVTELIMTGFPVSIKIGLWSIFIALIIGCTFGSIAALNQNSWLDYSFMSLSMCGIAIPNFVIAPMLSLIFGVYLRWLPVAGWGGGDFAHMLLPVISLTFPQVAYIARMTRGTMIEVLRSNFIRTARAKGLPKRLLLVRHAARPTILPIVSYLGPATAGIITGSVVIEQIFAIPGIGKHFVQGALNRDYTLVMGVVIFYGSLILLFNLIVDLIYGWLDPKVRYD